MPPAVADTRRALCEGLFGSPWMMALMPVGDAADTLRRMILSLWIGLMLLLLILSGMAVHRLRRPRIRRLFDIGAVSESWLAEHKKQS